MCRAQQGSRVGTARPSLLAHCAWPNWQTVTGPRQSAVLLCAQQLVINTLSFSVLGLTARALGGFKSFLWFCSGFLWTELADLINCYPSCSWWSCLPCPCSVASPMLSVCLLWPLSQPLGLFTGPANGHQLGRFSVWCPSHTPALRYHFWASTSHQPPENQNNYMS